MGFTESVTEVFVLFKMWSKHICFYIEGRRLVSQIKKSKKNLWMVWIICHNNDGTTSRTYPQIISRKSNFRRLFLSFKIQSKPVCRTQGSNWHFKWTMRCENQKDCVNIWIPRHLFRNTWLSERLSGTLYMKVIHHMCLYCSAYNQSVFLFRVSE